MASGSCTCFQWPGIVVWWLGVDVAQEPSDSMCPSWWCVVQACQQLTKHMWIDPHEILEACINIWGLSYCLTNLASVDFSDCNLSLINCFTLMGGHCIFDHWKCMYGIVYEEHSNVVHNIANLINTCVSVNSWTWTYLDLPT